MQRIMFHCINGWLSPLCPLTLTVCICFRLSYRHFSIRILRPKFDIRISGYRLTTLLLQTDNHTSNILNLIAVFQACSYVCIECVIWRRSNGWNIDMEEDWIRQSKTRWNGIKEDVKGFDVSNEDGDEEAESWGTSLKWPLTRCVGPVLSGWWCWFVQCVCVCVRCVELPSSYAELNAVFDVYDVTLSGHINYRELVKSVDRQVCFACLLYAALQTSDVCWKKRAA